MPVVSIMWITGDPDELGAKAREAFETIAQRLGD
jgi:hypothetical protein